MSPEYYRQSNSFSRTARAVPFRDGLLLVETSYRKRGSYIRSYRYLQGARRYIAQLFGFILSPYGHTLDRPSSFPLGRSSRGRQKEKKKKKMKIKKKCGGTL